MRRCSRSLRLSGSLSAARCRPTDALWTFRTSTINYRAFQSKQFRNPPPDIEPPKGRFRSRTLENCLSQPNSSSGAQKKPIERTFLGSATSGWVWAVAVSVTVTWFCSAVIEERTGGPEESPFSYRNWPFYPGRISEGLASPLLPKHFNKFILVDKEDISDNGTILTLQTNKPSGWRGNQDPYREFWSRGTWSVEIKQPQLQVSRRYTPLPPFSTPTRPHWELVKNGLLPPWQEDTTRNLRILVRREPTGEVSNYLHNIPLNTRVEIRGGYTEYEVPDDVEEVLFLAGGTGIAPAIQIAHALEDRLKLKMTGPRRMHVLWANRKRDECAGAEQLAKDNTASQSREMSGSNSLIRQIETLQRTSTGLHLAIDCFVDTERTFIKEPELGAALRRSAAANQSGRPPSKKLILVSGPDGFVEYIAGPKAYRYGKPYLGVTGGLLSRVNHAGWDVQRL